MFFRHANDPQDTQRAVTYRAPDSATGSVRGEFDTDLLVVLVRTRRAARRGEALQFWTQVWTQTQEYQT
jgi:hypothetical protein